MPRATAFLRPGAVEGAGTAGMMSVVDIRDRSAQRLERLAPAPVWRDVLATLVAGLTVLCSMGGLIVFAPGLQLALLAALCAALIASSSVRAAATAALGFTAAVLIGPTSAWSADASYAAKLTTLAPWVVLAAIGAALFREVLSRKWISPRLGVVAALVLLSANMWATTLSVNVSPTFDPTTGPDPRVRRSTTWAGAQEHREE